MRAHHALRHLEENRRIASAALRPGHRFDIDRVANEISFNHAVTIQNPLTTKITFFSLKPVRKSIRIIQHEVGGAKQIKNEWRCGDGQNARLPAPWPLKC